MMTLDYCIEQATTDGVINPDVLRAMLRTREDLMADHLRLAAQQFGLMPQIVAEVVAQLGLGTPLSAEERALVQQNFIALMEQIAEAQRQQNEGPDETGDGT